MTAWIGPAITAVASLFGGKKKDPTPEKNLLSQAKGARAASKEYGFNPLTMMQYGQTAGAVGGGGAPPLASWDFMAQALTGIEKELNGDADRERAADQLNLDLAKLRVDQARSGVAAVPNNAASSFGGPSPVGRNTATVSGSAGVPVSGVSFGLLGDFLASGYKADVRPVPVTSGIFTVNNGVSGGPVAIAGDEGEPWGLSELVSFGVQAVPQMAYNHYMNWVGKPFADWAMKPAAPPAPPRKLSANEKMHQDWFKKNRPEWLTPKGY